MSKFYIARPKMSLLTRLAAGCILETENLAEGGMFMTTIANYIEYTESATRLLGGVVNFRGVRIIGRAWFRRHCCRRMIKVAGIYQDATTKKDKVWWTSRQPVLFCAHPECDFLSFGRLLLFYYSVSRYC